MVRIWVPAPSAISNLSSLPWTVPVLALKVPHPREPFKPRRSTTFGHPHSTPSWALVLTNRASPYLLSATVLGDWTAESEFLEHHVPETQSALRVPLTLSSHKAELPLRICDLRVTSFLLGWGSFDMTTLGWVLQWHPPPCFWVPLWNLDSPQAKMNPRTKEASGVEGNGRISPQDASCRLEVRGRWTEMGQLLLVNESRATVCPRNTSTALINLEINPCCCAGGWTRLACSPGFTTGLPTGNSVPLPGWR